MSDEMSQREKRMQRHRSEARKGLPKTVAKTYGIWVVGLLVAAGVGYAIYSATTGGQECPGHWHATFGIFVPGPDGNPVKVDFATPRSVPGVPASVAYYDLNGKAKMGLSIHMHQSGSERGLEAHGPSQWHFELDGTCVGVRSALDAVEVDAEEDSLRLFGAHAQVGQDKTWTANETARLRWFVESEAGGNWTWQERTWAQVRSYQLRDGERLLVALGNYTDTQIQEMQRSIPVPISRS